MRANNLTLLMRLVSLCVGLETVTTTLSSTKIVYCSAASVPVIAATTSKHTSGLLDVSGDSPSQSPSTSSAPATLSSLDGLGAPSSVPPTVSSSAFDQGSGSAVFALWYVAAIWTAFVLLV